MTEIVLRGFLPLSRKPPSKIDKNDELEKSKSGGFILISSRSESRIIISNSLSLTGITVPLVR